MSCYFPLTAFKAKTTAAPKMNLTFRRSESWRGEKVPLPCGQCVGCRLERSRQWAVRCMHEAQMYDKNCFLTLTYNDDNLPLDKSLDLSHFQLFMKRLRKAYGSGIRYYHCGEYGEALGRPHYHALLFNHDFQDKAYFRDSGENRIYTSDSLSRLWPFGFSVIGDVTFESAAYVARYVMKKVTGVKSEDHYNGRTPEYSTMSRRPGIGRSWYDKYKSDVYPLDRVVSRGRECRPPRFYDDLLGKEDPSTLALIKIKRGDENERYVTDTLSDGSTVVESDSSFRRLLIKNEVKEAQVAQLVRHKEIP